MKIIVLFLLARLPRICAQRNRRLGSQTAAPSGSPASNPWPESYYHTFDPEKLGGPPNVTAALGNPLKGIFGGVRWAPPPLPEYVPFSLEWYNLALNEVMIGPNAFNWTALDKELEGSAARKKHAVFSFYIDWPNSNPETRIKLPGYLMDTVEMIYYDPNDPSVVSPYYGDPDLLEALEQFITALGARYDGDKRIYLIHLGLLGFFGEFHTFPYNYLVPESAKESVILWYKRAFITTMISARYPITGYTEGIGLNDGSFALQTLDGIYNGGVEKGWYFWPKTVSSGQADFYKHTAMGGEVHPSLQSIIFSDTYPGGTYERQWFSDCVEVTHASAILLHHAYKNEGYTGSDLEKARLMSASMGYSFQISGVAVTEAAIPGYYVDISIQVTQLGVAPFYYDLVLALSCSELSDPSTQNGFETLFDRGDTQTFEFVGIPATEPCLRAVSLSLESSYAYETKPILFAQGETGKVVLDLPLPEGARTAQLTTSFAGHQFRVYCQSCKNQTLKGGPVHLP